jgi:hypothetical protein
MATDMAAYRSVFSFCLTTPWSEEGGSRSLVVRSCRQKSRHPLLALAFLESHLPKLDVAGSESCVLHQSFTDGFGFEVRVRNRCRKGTLAVNLEASFVGWSSAVGVFWRRRPGRQ